MGKKKEYYIVKDRPDFEPFKKSIFRLKLDGTYDNIFRMAYMLGYMEGHEFGKTMGTVNADDLEIAYAEFKVWLDNQLREKNLPSL